MSFQPKYNVADFELPKGAISLLVAESFFSLVMVAGEGDFISFSERMMRKVEVLKNKCSTGPDSGRVIAFLFFSFVVCFERSSDIRYLNVALKLRDLLVKFHFPACVGGAIGFNEYASRCNFHVLSLK